MFEERTIWERLRLLPSFKRTAIRKELAEKMGIDPNAVLKHLKKNGWHDNLKLIYKKHLQEITGLEEEDWANPNSYLVIDNLTMKYRLRELCPEDMVVEGEGGEGL